MASFIIDANLPRSMANILLKYQHLFVDVRDIRLGTASDQDIAQYAKSDQLVILTADGDFGDICSYPPVDYFGIVVINRPYRSSTLQVLQLLEQLLLQWGQFEPIRGKLVVVEQGCIRIRQ
jgi:predicted nuclease of predicted toxin-antitoxin system